MYLSKEQFLLLIITITLTTTLIIAFFAIVLVRIVKIRKIKAIEIRDAMLAAQEYERTRIAEDLHDELGSQLSAIKLQLINIEDSFNTNKIELVTIKNGISTVIENLRATARNLSAALLEKIGLIEGIKEAIGIFNKNKRIKIRFNENCSETVFPNNYQLILYRLTLELINNSFKHSNCSEITINLLKNGNKLYFEYNDNGQRVASDSGIEGMGLKNVKNRVLFIKGTILNFTTTFEHGAHYSFSFLI